MVRSHSRNFNHFLSNLIEGTNSPVKEIESREQKKHMSRVAYVS